MGKRAFQPVFLLTTALALACCQNNDQLSKNQVDRNFETAKPSKSGETYNIDGKNVLLRKGPGNQYERLVNEKATRALKSTQYLAVDYTVKVSILETSGEWSKIKVIEPDWLADTHVGWIPTKNILKRSPSQESETKNLNPGEYEIIKSNQNSSPPTFYVLIKQRGFNEDSVFAFVNAFRDKHCAVACNVYVYDSKSIVHLIEKYPLERQEYISVADHFVSMSTFDSPEVKSWYPFQDFQYKEYGGKNWKKTPLR